MTSARCMRRVEPRRPPLLELIKTKRGQGGACAFESGGGISAISVPSELTAFDIASARYSGIVTIFLSSSSFIRQCGLNLRSGTETNVHMGIIFYNVVRRQRDAVLKLGSRDPTDSTQT